MQHVENKLTAKYGILFNTFMKNRSKFYCLKIALWLYCFIATLNNTTIQQYNNETIP